MFGIVSTVNFIHQKLNLIVCHNEQISFIKQEKIKSLKKADSDLNSLKPQDGSKMEKIRIRDFFFEEPSSPLSPFKKGPNRRTRYGQFPRNQSKIEEDSFNLTKYSNELRLSSFMLHPKSVPQLDDSRKKDKIKRRDHKLHSLNYIMKDKTVIVLKLRE